MVGELLDQGAEIDAEECHGLTPFVSRDANTAITDDQGNSLLDIARILGHTNIYLWLERQGIS